MTDGRFGLHDIEFPPALTDPDDPDAVVKGVTGPLLRDHLETYAGRLPVRTVTVVGNAPLEPSADRAAAIDASELVFRCNSFVLDEPGDAPTLGTKVDVCVIAFVTRPTKFLFRDYRSRAYLVPEVGHAWTLGKPNVPEWVPSWPEDLGAMPIPNDTIGLATIREMLRGGPPRPAVPTTGTLAAALAHEFWPDATLQLTGFSYLHDREQTSWRHHHGDKVPVHPAHLLDREGAILQGFIDHGHARYLA